MRIIRKFNSFLEGLKTKYELDNLSLKKGINDDGEGTISLMDKNQILCYINVELVSLEAIINKTFVDIKNFDYKLLIDLNGIKEEDYDKIFFLYIYDVKTFKEFRGKGYASILMHKLIEKSNSLNYPYILLKAFPVEKSDIHRLVEFYSRFGFKEINKGDGGVYMVYKNAELK